MAENPLQQALEALQRYALTCAMPTPHPEDTNPKLMGKLYDHWVTCIIRDGRSAGIELDKVVLRSQRSAAAHEHMRTFVKIVQNRFEHTLDYRVPYAPGSNPHGLVWADDDDTHWFKPAVRSVHRAIALQWLALHLMRLHYLIMLIRTAESTNDIPLTLNDEARESIQQGLQTLRDALVHVKAHAFCPAQLTLDQDKYMPLFTDLMEIMWQSDEMDIPPDAWQKAALNFNDPFSSQCGLARDRYSSLNLVNYQTFTPLDQRTLGRHLVTNYIGYYGNEINHARSNPNGDDTAEDMRIADDLRLGVAHVRPRPYSAFELALIQYKTWRHTIDDIVHPDDEIKPEHLHILMSGGVLGPLKRWLDARDRFLAGNTGNDNELSQSTQAHPRGFADTKLVPVSLINNGTLTDSYNRMYDTVAQFTSSTARALAFSAIVHTSDDNVPIKDICSTTQNATHLCKSILCAARADVHGFQPQWHEDRAYLHKRLVGELTVVSSLHETDGTAVPHSFVMNRNRQVVQRRIVSLWRKRIRSNTKVQRLFHAAHCEVALMSDVYNLLGRLAAASSRSLQENIYPQNEIVNLYDSLANPLLPLRIAEDVLVQDRGNILHIDAEVTQKMLDAIEAMRALPPPVANLAGTTQPMPDTTRDWAEGLSNVYDTELNNAMINGGAVNLMTVFPNYVPGHTLSFQPLIQNASSLPTELPTLKNPLPTRLQASFPDSWGVDNVLAYSTPTPATEALLRIGVNAYYPMIFAAVVGAHLHNSATLKHLLEACRGLMQNDVAVDVPMNITIPGTRNARNFEVHLFKNGGMFNNVFSNRPEFNLGYFNAGGNFIPDQYEDVIGALCKHVLRWMSVRMLHAPSVARHVVNIETTQTAINSLERLRTRMHNDYRTRPQPYLHPSAWLAAAPPAPVPPNNPYQYRLLRVQDMEPNGIIFELPPPAPAAGGGGAAAGAPPPPTPLQLFMMAHLTEAPGHNY